MYECSSVHACWPQVYTITTYACTQTQLSNTVAVYLPYLPEEQWPPYLLTFHLSLLVLE